MLVGVCISPYWVSGVKVPNDQVRGRKLAAKLYEIIYGKRVPGRDINVADCKQPVELEAHRDCLEWGLEGYTLECSVVTYEAH
jgi:hypothetical protein